MDSTHDYRIAVALAQEGQPVDLRQALGDPLPRFLVLSPTHPATAFRMRGTDINVPRPGRFAFHNLVVASRRGGALPPTAKRPKIARKQARCFVC